MSHSRLTLGKSGETLAEKYLRQKGYRIITKNFRTKLGEIDIIALDGDVVVFVEVKTRRGRFLESPLAAVTPKKQRQIGKVAQLYLSQTHGFDKDARFDVIAIQLSVDTPAKIEHIENAFDLGTF